MLFRSSEILDIGYGECCRHSVVGTSILRANKIPARTVCAAWATDDSKNQGPHCWGEFFLDGVGWVPYDTTLDHERPDTDAYFAQRKGLHIADMIDFDWVINAGKFGKQKVFAINELPVYWSRGTGSLDNPKVETNGRVRVLKRFPRTVTCPI